MVVNEGIHNRVEGRDVLREKFSAAQFCVT